MSVYEKFDYEFVKVPVQYGRLSRRPRKCRNIGSLGSMHEENWREDYYRIDDTERSGGKFFFTRKWRGDIKGNLDSKGEIWSYTMYTQYNRLPDEIKQIIIKKKEG